MTEMYFGVFEGIELKDLLELDSYHNWIKGGLDNPPPNGESLHNLPPRRKADVLKLLGVLQIFETRQLFPHLLEGIRLLRPARIRLEIRLWEN